MPLKAPGFPPVNQADWDRWTRGTTVIPDDNSITTVKIEDKSVTDQKLRDSAPASVIGRLNNTPGTPTDIVAPGDNTFLVRRSGTLEFAGLADTDIPATIARETDVTAAITALQAQSDPFPVYLTQTEGDARYVQLSNVLNASVTYDPPSLADGAGTTTTVTVTGAALGDFALASFSLDLQGITVSAYVSSSNTVSVRFQNESGGTLDLASGTLRVRVWKQ